MLTVEEALHEVLTRCSPRSAEEVSLSGALGRVLSADAVSDVDSPPHDKSMVDGYAVLAADLHGESAELIVLEEVIAGAVPTQTVHSGMATRIMTGAPIPDGADAVVMVEKTQLLDADEEGRERVRIEEPGLPSGANILPQGVAMRAGEIVLTAGARLRACDIGVLAEIGCDPAPVFPQPRVAVLSTGNELVPATEALAPGQIRNSNGPMLAALILQACATPRNLGIGRDSKEELRELIDQGLSADVLVLSGGVSAGVMDLVPGVLDELGVQQVFHKVQLKPGKPLWFGMLEQDDHRCLVFGLPGNPVSSFVCFELFVRGAVRKLAGEKVRGLDLHPATLASPFLHRGPRPTYHPARYRISEGGVMAVEPIRWQGSADLRALANANALAVFPPGNHEHAQGDHIQFVLL